MFDHEPREDFKPLTNPEAIKAHQSGASSREADQIGKREKGAGQVSDQEVWCPDAEPWEALREAQRSGAAPVHMAKALSEMGWRLAPAPVPVPEEPGGTRAELLQTLEDAAYKLSWGKPNAAAHLIWEALGRADWSRSKTFGSLDPAECSHPRGPWRSCPMCFEQRDNPAPVPVPEEPEGEEGRTLQRLTLRRLTAVEEAIWGRYHGKHRDAGLLNKVNYLTRRVDALESAAPEGPDDEIGVVSEPAPSVAPVSDYHSDLKVVLANWGVAIPSPEAEAAYNRVVQYNRRSGCYVT